MNLDRTHSIADGRWQFAALDKQRLVGLSPRFRSIRQPKREPFFSYKIRLCTKTTSTPIGGEARR
jgi:hypothetical protein